MLEPSTLNWIVTFLETKFLKEFYNLLSFLLQLSWHLKISSLNHWLDILIGTLSPSWECTIPMHLPLVGREDNKDSAPDGAHTNDTIAAGADVHCAHVSKLTNTTLRHQGERKHSEHKSIHYIVVPQIVQRQTSDTKSPHDGVEKH